MSSPCQISRVRTVRTVSRGPARTSSSTVFNPLQRGKPVGPPLIPCSTAGPAGVTVEVPAVATDRVGAVFTTWQEHCDGFDVNTFLDSRERTAAH